MKRTILLSVILFLSTGFVIDKIIERNAHQIIKQLGISDESAKDYIWSNCSGILFYFPSPKELKNAAMGERASIVRAIGNYAKEYSRSSEFLEKYKEFKVANKPEPPEPPQSGGGIKNEQKNAYLKSIAEMEKVKKSMPEDQQAAFEETIKSMKEQLKELDDPANAANYEQMDVMIRQGYEEQQKEYQEKLKQWELDYPDNPKLMIKAWLSRFIEETNDVNFNAELKENNHGQKVFVNPDYENKSHLWKLCFRSGKETLTAGREFAQQWLKELK